MMNVVMNVISRVCLHNGNNAHSYLCDRPTLIFFTNLIIVSSCCSMFTTSYIACRHIIHVIAPEIHVVLSFDQRGEKYCNL